MNQRHPALEQALQTLKSAFQVIVPRNHQASTILNEAFDKLAVPHVPTVATTPQFQPAVNFLKPAADMALQGPKYSSAFTRDLMNLETMLHWIKAENMAPGFEMPSDYAESYLVGPNGIEVRKDVQVGISILNSDIVYPAHRHAPEEIYLAMTGGFWRQKDENWNDHEAGSFIYNSSNTLHSLAAKPYPQLSVWVLLNR